jgi:hypothetical protein
MENLINRIKEIIEEEQLQIRNQNPIKVSRRWFFYLWLRKNGFVLREIAELFNVGHATVIHGIKQAEYFQTKKNDKYLLFTSDLYLEFMDKKISFDKRNLATDVMNCKNFQMLVIIKKRIKNNLYVD